VVFERADGETLMLSEEVVLDTDIIIDGELLRVRVKVADCDTLGVLLALAAPLCVLLGDCVEEGDAVALGVELRTGSGALSDGRGCRTTGSCAGAARATLR